MKIFFDDEISGYLEMQGEEALDQIKLQSKLQKMKVVSAISDSFLFIHQDGVQCTAVKILFDDEISRG